VNLDVPVADAAPEPNAPGARRRAIAEEQRHLDRIHDRVEHLRRVASERVMEAAADRSGSTFQARFERDVTAHHHATRQARYTFGDVESLAFGRLDLRDGDRMHVGRVSVVDDQGDVVLVDWRAPAAAAFYQATAAQPDDVARRRTLVTRGRTVKDLDDEVLDPEAADELGLTAVTGQGALLAALSRERTGSMRDIVATIQADQDAIIRSPATGTLVVTGGPGTGKTVVALHRVAFLLYRDRDRFEGRGVLVIGPSDAFTEYTARVLPALGEDRAVQRPLAALAPRGTVVSGWDDLEVARVKGDLAMIEVCRRALGAVLPPIPPDTRVSFEGTTVTVPPAEVERVRERQLRRLRADANGASYHERTDAADQSLRAVLWKVWGSAHRSSGGRVPDAREGSGFDAALERSPQVRMLRRCYWPELTASEVLGRLATGDVDLPAVIGSILTPQDVQRLVDAWADADAWTIDDVGLLDELAALLGPSPSRSARREPKDDGGLRVSSDAWNIEAEPVDVEADEYRDFAHVVVDEAQDLTPMQWRAVARRGPYASWTVVGDLAQRSRVADPATWDDVAKLIGRRQVAIRNLSVNYRTPAEIAEVALDVLIAAGHDPASAPRAVRGTGTSPRLVTSTDLAGSVRELVAQLTAHQDGTVAVIAPQDHLASLRSAVAELPSEVAERVRVHDPRTVKGLEFDDVLVVAPDRIVEGSAVGTHQLYVAVTRATRSLHVVASEDARFPGRDRLVPVDRAVTDNGR
jgi:DNA helicase IV